LLYQLFGTLIGSPKYFPFFLGKGRTLLKYSIAQKTPKNICLNLFEKGNRKLFFINKLRRKSSPKFSIKLWGKLSALCFLTLCVIPTIRFVLDSPKYFPFFFGKGRTLPCRNILLLSSPYYSIKQYPRAFGFSFCITFGPG
jgi:hypothetical protein